MHRALAILTTLLLVAAGIAGYTRAAFADREAFSARAASALEDEDVRTAVATRVVDRVAGSVSADVLTVRPLLIAALRTLAATPVFRRAAEAAAADAHRQLLGGSSSYVVALGPSSPIVEDALRSVAPRVARALPADLRFEIIEISPNDAVLRGARTSADLARWWWALLIAAGASAAALAALSRSVRHATASLGAAVLAAGLTVAAGVTVVGLAVAQTDDPVRRAARSALWSAFMGDLRTTALLAALAGAIVVAAAAAAGAPDPLSRVADAVRPLARSARPAARLARAAMAVALGAGLILAPALAAQVAATAAGVLLVLLGARQLWPRDAASGPPSRDIASGRLLALAVAGPAAAALIAVVLVLPSPASAPARPAPTAACNGTAALCDRRLNEVVFPATHNSYSAADEPGWLFANQRHGIAQQLRDGIRGMLIDVHYGVSDPESGRVRTDLRAEGSSRSKVAQSLSPAALRAADRLGERVGGPLTGERRPYLCHTLCELGAEPLGEQLRLIRDFLAAEPREVVILFVEPYVAVEEIERALKDAGLLSQAAPLRRDAPLPTLGELVDAGTRLVILSEEDGGSRPWYLPGFSFAQDTPLGARGAGDLECRRFRGDANSPLFLVNHWVDTFPPSPSRNERIGSDVLRGRLERCGRERGLVPNLVAVDFYERTGVVALAAALNR